ncbi:FecR family protein [Sphingomonas colocasiae]|uniref:FecR domain-containing protein n=1 Tax=Sphingomonas colocasiae TaxID=1848973 RepID=A0ABS7PS37_9SPHN|nr:FecR domain-containing protein [Sphingomonas colocasiae]MBY8824152.1 FecR domain-containing protein [Sphingomonas colocasiae]
MSEVEPLHQDPVSDEAGLWCFRIAEADLDEVETAQFESWMAASPDHRAAFDRAVFVWRSLDGSQTTPALLDIRLKALEALRGPEVKRAGRIRNWRLPGAVAAAVVVALLATFLAVRDRATIYETGIGERRQIVLADGSRLSLDAATRVEVDYTDDRRALTLLAGRAKFDVAKNPLRPFSVAAGDKMVVAIGTSFSVERLRSQVDVVLYEGQVAVMKPAPGTSPRPVPLDARIPVDQALRPGQEMTLPDGDHPVHVAGVDEPRALSWESGQLSFVDEPLGEVVERMNRYSQTRLVVGDAETAGLLVSGVFDATDTSSFLEGLAGVFSVRSRTQDGKVVLTKVRG